jgi:hypothetical protein
MMGLEEAANLTDVPNALVIKRKLKLLAVALLPISFISTQHRFTLNPIHQMPGLNT